MKEYSVRTKSPKYRTWDAYTKNGKTVKMTFEEAEEHARYTVEAFEGFRARVYRGREMICEY